MDVSKDVYAHFQGRASPMLVGIAFLQTGREEVFSGRAGAVPFG
jgi:hypothetical protein